MLRSLLLAILLAGLAAMTPRWAEAGGSLPVWIALTENGGMHAEAADALQATVEQSLPGRVTWRVAPWTQLTAPGQRPRLIVTVGTAALRGILEAFSGDSAGHPPILATLLPRTAYERLAEAGRSRAAGSLSAVYLDQPASRQMELIRLALPLVRNVGIMLGNASRNQAAALEKAASERNLRALIAPVGDSGIFPVLHALLPDAEVILAVPDPDIFNSQTVASILTAAYRQQTPLIGFSPAYVKAGALLGLFSSPAQVGQRGGELVVQALGGAPLPPPQWPRDFTVLINSDVARSLGLILQAQRLTTQLQAREGGRP